MLPGMGRGWRAQHVSIRARPIGRAMRTDHSGSSSYTRVSIRARPIGRAMPGRCGGRGRSGQVSIRARPIGRAMRRCGQAAASGVTFQSAPGRLAGRCDRPLARWSHLDGFNPRPADWPGDAAAEAEERQRQAVSIRARPIGRAMLPSGVGLLHTKSFQSAPGRLAGRCGAATLTTASSSRFNPRPADWPGDASLTHCGKFNGKLFQSAPGRLAGRCWRRDFDNGIVVAFQSAPGRLAGRCIARNCNPSRAGIVSIRARPIGRAMRPLRQCARSPDAVSIRARPIGRAMRTDVAGGRLVGDVSIRARPIGRAMLRARLNLRDPPQVSIRARPIGRAMLTCRPRATDLHGTFQSAPGRLAGRCAVDAMVARSSERFNPRPADWPGDAARSGASSTAAGRFNPRPADWPGDAAVGWAGDTGIACFNPRPADWPGDALAALRAQAAQHVSIRARPIGRAMPAGRCQRLAGSSRFNPRPADWPGDARRPVQCRAGLRQFQSAPGRLAGRCRPPPREGTATDGFNPRPADWPGDATVPGPWESLPSSFNPRPADWPGDARHTTRSLR